MTYVFTPEFLSLNAEDLDADAARGGDVVRDELRGEGGVPHDAVVGSWFGKHALSEMWSEVIVDGEFADHALREVSLGREWRSLEGIRLGS